MDYFVDRVDTGIVEMDYFRFGNGEKTIVILPGLSVQSVIGSAEQIAKAYDCFSNDFTVYVFDRRRNMPDVYRPDDIARDTVEAFRLLNLKDLYLFGASQGGMISLEIAALFPELVKKTAVGSVACDIRDYWNSMFSDLLNYATDRDAQSLLLTFAQKIYPPVVFAQSRDLILEAGKAVTDNDLDRFAVLVRGMKGYDATQIIKNIRCPVLLLGSYDDGLITREITEKTIKSLSVLKDFQYHIYEGYGHASYDIAPDYKNRLYDFFMGES